jgi:hypothetical protein
LAGLRPVTLHEYPVVPRSPRERYERLTEEQKRLNDAHSGTWVRD